MFNKKGNLLSLAILILLLSAITIFGVGNFLVDRFTSHKSDSIKETAVRESENALIYGIYASGTKITDGGRKCHPDWYVLNEEGFETTNEDSGRKTTIEGYTIRRFITFKGTVDWHDAVLTGIARIYNGDKLISEEKTTMNVNLLYNGTDQGADNICTADSVELKRETWQNQ